MNTCSACNAKGDFICFCSQTILCKKCIGLHLTQEPILGHKPVALKDDELASLVSESLPELQQSEADILAKTKRRLSLSTAVQEKVTAELKELEQFEMLGLQFTQELVKITMKQLENATARLTTQVKNRCLNLKTDVLEGLEAYKQEDLANPVAQILASCQTAKEVRELKLLTKEIDFAEVNIMNILEEAFTFDVHLTQPSSRKSLQPKPAPPVKPAESRKSMEPMRTNTEPHRLNKNARAITMTSPDPPRISSLFKSPTALKGSSKLAETFTRLSKPKKKLCPHLYHFHFPTQSAYTFNALTSELQTKELPKQEIGVKGSTWALTPVGLVVVTGGYSGTPKNTTWLYSLQNQQFKLGAGMRHPRFYHCTVAAGDYVYVMGGANRTALTECEKYSLALNKWSKVAHMKVPRYKHSGVLANDKIFVCGGADLDSVEVYSPQTNVFELLPLRLPSPGKTLGVLSGTNVLVLGQQSVSALNTEDLTIREVGRLQEAGWWSQGYSILWGKHTFFVRKKVVYRFDLTTCAASVVTQMPITKRV